MKKTKVMSIFLLVAMMAIGFVGCSKDDDSGNSLDLKTYAIGSWHSYKAIVYIMGGEYSGKSVEASISKTGQYSESYMEFTFRDANRAIFGAFHQDEYGISHWEEEEITYLINGGIVTAKDSEGTTLDLVFNEKDKTLCIQMSATKDGIPMRLVVYLKKK